MDQHKDHIISFELLKRYLGGEVSESEKNQVEKALQDDSFLAEAYEGLLLNTDLNKTENILEEISSEVTKKTQKKAIILPFYRRIAVAASVIVLVALSALIYWNIQSANNEQIFADNYEKFPAQEEAETDLSEDTFDQKETLPTLENSANGIKQIELTEIENEPSFSNISPAEMNVDEEVLNIELEEYEILEDMDIAVEDEIVLEKSESDKSVFGAGNNISPQELKKDFEQKDSVYSLEEEKETASQDIIVIDNNNSISFSKEATSTEISEVQVTRSKNKSRNESKYVIKAQIDDQLQKGLENYNNSNYQIAIEQYKIVLQSEKNNLTALYYLGLCYMELEDTKNAIQHFDKVLDIADNKYLEDAEWYKALALVKRNKVNQAKSLLQQILEKEGKYLKEATKLLDSF